MGNQKDMFGHVIVPTDTSASESWTDREKVLKLLKGNRRCDENHHTRPRLRVEDRKKDRQVKPRNRKSLNRSSSPNSATIIEIRVTAFRKSISTKDGLPTNSSDCSSAKEEAKRKTRSQDRVPSKRSRSSDVSPYHSAKPHGSSVRLPSFSKQHLPRGADAPAVLKDDPRLRKRRKSGWGSVADALAARDGFKEGETDIAHTRLLERTLFALRGFGCFDITWGIGSYGKNFAELIRRIGTDNTEDMRVHHVKCKVANRIAYGFSNLKFGSKKLGFEDEKNLILGDFCHVPNAELELHFLVDGKMEKRPEEPKTVENFGKCVENQTNLRCLFFGEQYRDERELALQNLLELNDDAPELFSLDFLVVTWETFMYDYVDKTFEGMRRLGQFCRPSDDIVEIRRLALARHPSGGIIWKHPLSFNMASSRGYWRRNLLPRLEAGVEKVGYSVALEKIVGVKKAGKRGNYNVGAGDQQLPPLGKRLSAEEREIP